jgi:hypothetical protein
MKGLASLRLVLVAAIAALSVSACAGNSATPAPVAGAFGQSAAVGPAGMTPRAVGRAQKPPCPNPVSFDAPALPPTCTIYVGGFISPTQGETPSQQIASELTFEQEIGRHMGMAMHYYQWTDAWPGILEANDTQNGRIPVISWHCGTTDAEVIAGNWDSLLTQRALAVAAYGRPIFVRYKWEMNLLYPKKGNGTECEDPAHDYPIPKGGHKVQYNPQYFIWAWDHIRSVFYLNGATNVVWLFNPSSSGVDPNLYYPGDSEVDWVGFDHYGTKQIKDFEVVFTQKGATHGGRELHTYPYFVAQYPNKPLMIAETGELQPAQPTFIGGADAALQNDFPHIQAVLYWDSTGCRGDYQLLQYGIQAYKQFASGPYEQGFYQSNAAQTPRSGLTADSAARGSLGHLDPSCV